VIVSILDSLLRIISSQLLCVSFTVDIVLGTSDVIEMGGLMNEGSSSRVAASVFSSPEGWANVDGAKARSQ